MKATGSARPLESRIARLLMAGTYTAVALIGVGVLLMALTGLSPLDGAPAFDPGRVVADLVSIEPSGFLWMGVLVILATPLARVVAAAVGFGRARELEMTLVAVGILAVIGLGVLAGTAGG